MTFYYSQPPQKNVQPSQIYFPVTALMIFSTKIHFLQKLIHKTVKTSKFLHIFFAFIFTSKFLYQQKVVKIELDKVDIVNKIEDKL